MRHIALSIGASLAAAMPASAAERLDAFEFGQILAAIDYCDLHHDLEAIAGFVDRRARDGWTIGELRLGRQAFMREHGNMEPRGLEFVAVCTLASARLHQLGLQER